MSKVLLVVEIDSENLAFIKKKVKKTKKWVDEDVLAGDGFCLTNDPEFTDDIWSVTVDIIMEYNHNSIT